MRKLLVLSLAIAGLMHLALTGEHYAESAVLGIGFVVAAVVQLALAVGVLRAPSPTIYWGVVGLNAVLVLLYVVHVTVGLPLGGEQASMEEIAPSGLATKAAEIVGIALAIGSLNRARSIVPAGEREERAAA